jgi:hypothetical protein
VVTAASDRRMRRRGRKRQEEPGTTPEAVGTALRAAREASGVSLTEVHDRTGTPWQLLEALEAGDLSRFPDRRSALTAVRRYADLMELDGDNFTQVTEEHWGGGGTGSASVGGADGRANGGRHQNVYATDSLSVGHLSRYPGEGTHLRAFTQTDEVPGVRRGDVPSENGPNSNGQWSITGSLPVTPTGFTYVRPAPWLLRGAVWTTASLLAVALVALAVQHYQPQWLADIHIVRHPVVATPTTAAPSTPGAPGAPARSALVTQTNTGAGSATIAVRASNYTVRVGAWAPCWTEVHNPQSFAPVFAATLQAGQLKDFNSSNGQLTVSMSAVHVTVQVRINGKTVPKWVFTPSSVPFTLNFNSTTS